MKSSVMSARVLGWYMTLASMTLSPTLLERNNKQVSLSLREGILPLHNPFKVRRSKGLSGPALLTINLISRNVQSREIRSTEGGRLINYYITSSLRNASSGMKAFYLYPRRVNLLAMSSSNFFIRRSSPCMKAPWILDLNFPIQIFLCFLFSGSLIRKLLFFPLNKFFN